MAARAPATNNFYSSTFGVESSNRSIDNRGLEVGIAGMSLVSSMPHLPGRKITSSTVSSSPPDNHEDDLPQGSAPGSPSNEKHHNMSSLAKNQVRPPGLVNTALPSPISKPGHSKNSSATSPLLTLTPNSSVDGNAEWLNTGRQASPYHSNDAPSMPFLQPDSRRFHVDDLSTNLSNLDISADNDGLLGLDALRERASSMPFPCYHSSSPPISTQSYFPSRIPGQQNDSERPRSSRDRPPLSQSFGESHLNSDRSVGGMSNPFSTRSLGEPNNVSMESSDSRGFGAIGRPELRMTATEYEPRRRSSSQDNLQNPYYQQQQQGVQEHVSHKFGSLPSLSSQIHQQQKRMPDNYNDVQKARHVRSISQPGIPNHATSQQLPPGIDSRYYSHQPHSYSGDHSSFKPTRSASISHQVLPQSYEGMHYSKSGSMPNLGAPVGYGSYHSYSNVQRREGFDFQLSPGSHSTGAIMSEDMLYGSPSPLGQSPHQVHYAGHSRQTSDGAMVMNPGRSHGLGRHSNSDEDLTHPLVGEHIEVPDHDDPHGGGIPDAIPSQFIEPHLRPTAGSALPAPKVVYAVKFKRSQRNFVLGPRISRDLKIGTYVKVEADRGEDLGIVVGKVPSEKYAFSARTSFTAGMGPAGIGAGTSDLKRIIRLATHDEVSLLGMKREEEEELLKICRRKVRDRGLPMNVVDAEYQFDRHKLTFFFEAEGRVDFRELVRDLFSMYKTRIWMQQLDKNTSTSAQAIVSPQAANLQMDYGTPIIAPASEFADSIIFAGMSGFDSRSH